MATVVPTFTADDILLILANVGDWIFFIGLVIVPIMIIIGAAIFLTAGGDPTRMGTAKKIFTWTGVGLILIVMARGVFTVLRSITGV